MIPTSLSMVRLSMIQMIPMIRSRFLDRLDRTVRILLLLSSLEHL